MYFLFIGFYSNTVKSQDSVVDIATGYGLDDQRGRSSSPGRVKNFLFFTSARPVLGFTQPRSYPVGTGGSFQAAGSYS
jgi:hypothetical protein